MHFAALPNELYAQIFEHCSDQLTLSKISLTSRKLHAVIEPFLYSHVKQTGSNTTPLLIRTLIANPHLALHVKKYTITPARINFEKNIFPCSEDQAQLCSANNVLQLHPQLKTICKSFADKFEKTVASNNAIRERTRRREPRLYTTPEAIENIFVTRNFAPVCNVGSQGNCWGFDYWAGATALLFAAFSSNLEVLDVKAYGNARFVSKDEGWGMYEGSDYFQLFPFVSAYENIEHVLGYIAKTQIGSFHTSLLRKLHTIYMCYKDPGMCAEQIAPFLLPSVLNFKSELESEYDRHQQTHPRFEHEKRVLPTKSVSIYSHGMETDQVEGLLERFSSIEYFEYVELMCNPPAIEDALGYFQHCLKDLHIYFPRNRYQASPDELGDLWTRPLITTLRSFEKLTALTIPVPIILGYESESHLDQSSSDLRFDDCTRYSAEQILAFVAAIPQGLKHLDLVECTPSISPCLTSLFAATPPALQTVNVIFCEDLGLYWTSQDFTDKQWDYLEHIAHNAGVLLTKNKTPHAKHRSGKDLLGIQCAESVNKIFDPPYDLEGNLIEMDMKEKQEQWYSP